MGKQRLGKGLAALISDTLGDEASAQVREIAIAQIRPNPQQPRTLFDPIKLEELAASIKEVGILQPVLVRRIGHEQYELVAGERRYRAAQMAGLTAVPALVKELDDRAQLELAIVENLQREDIGVIESARAYRRLIDQFGFTQDLIAQRVGKSRSSVANVLRLLALPDKVLESLEAGEVTEGHARALLGILDPEDLLAAWETVRTKHLSVRETEALARREKPAEPARKPSSAVTAAREAIYEYANERDAIDRLRVTFGTNVMVKRSGAGGKIELEFYSEEEFERLVEILLSRGPEHPNG